MSLISMSNLRRFKDNLLSSALTFYGSVVHYGTARFNGGMSVNRAKAEFNAPVAFKDTTTYKDVEVATKFDVSSALTSYVKKNADDNLDMTSHAILFPGTTILSEPVNSVPTLKIKTTGRGVLLNNTPIADQNYVIAKIQNLGDEFAKYDEQNNANLVLGEMSAIAFMDDGTVYKVRYNNIYTGIRGKIISDEDHLMLGGNELWVE